MVKKRYAELVVGISKGAPQALTLLDIVIGMGQYIPERDLLTYFLKSTVSGRIGDGDSTSEKKQHTQENRQQNRGEKTDCIH